MAIDPTPDQALRARLARPRLGRGRRPLQGPGGRPRPRDDAGAEAAARRDRVVTWPSTPTSARRPIPALHAAQRYHGWCSPTAIEQAACVMRLTPGYLTAVATFYDMFVTVPQGEHTIFVCTNISCSLRGADAIHAAMQDAAGADARFNVRGFECLGACDIAPMASVNGDYLGPLTEDDCRTIVDDLLAGKPPLPDKQLAHSPVGRDAGDAEVKLFYEDIDRPGLNTLRGLREGRRLRDAQEGAEDGARGRARRAAGLRGPRSRRRRLRDGQEGVLPAPRARWTSTSSATPTSPSRGPSRTAS